MSDTIDKLKKARINLSRRSPFFSFLSYNLQFEKMKRQKEEDPGIIISDDGILSYDDDYIKSLSSEEVVGVICHEVMHMSLSHLLRRKSRQKDKWDFAADLCVNSILDQNDFVLPYGSSVPKNGMFETEHQVLIDLDKKSVEQIYDEIEDPPQDKKPKGGKGKGQNPPGQSPPPPNGNGEGEGNGDNKQGPGRYPPGFDKHKENEKQSQSERQNKESQWKQKLSAAYIHGKQKGNIPLGMERIHDQLFKEEIDWRALLTRYLQRLMPVDYTWARPHKKSYSIGVYFPDIVREKIEVIIAIDTSGSISKADLNDFISEVRGMVRAYQNRISVRILSHDVEVHSDQEFLPFDMNIISKLNLKGGGGTSHKPVMEALNKKLQPGSVAIFFTDGYSDIQRIEFRKNRFNSIFVISRHGTDSGFKDNRDILVVKMKEDKYERNLL